MDDDWIEKFLARVGAPPETRSRMGPIERNQVKKWLDGLTPEFRSRFLDGGSDHPDIPFAKASLRYAPGTGYVQVPHRYRITFRTPIGDDVSYEVQTFRGRDKAISLATDAHIVTNRPWHDVDVEELGPTEPGGSPTAIDDRSEW